MSPLPLSDHIPTQPESKPSNSNDRISQTKRRRDNGNDAITEKLREKKKPKKAQKRNNGADKMLDLRENVNTAIGRMDNNLLADYVARSTKRFAQDLSLVELEDKRLPASAFSNTSDWDSLRTLENLPSFLDHCSTSFGKKVNILASASASRGSPHTIVITSAGLRAADLTRALRSFQREDAVVAKLFAKHIKLQKAIEMIKTTRMNFGVGTPSRIIDLLDSGALSLSALDRVVVDCSYVDQKRRGVFDMRETQEPLVRLLNRRELKDRYGSGQADVQLLFY